LTRCARIAPLLAALLLCPAYADQASGAAPADAVEARVAQLLARLTPAEKVTLLAGGGGFTTAAIPRLSIPAIRLSDGPNGVRSNEGETATVFPTGSALAASWDPELLQAVGAAIGREARALGVQVMLGPDVNIQRVPLAGRNFEDYSEDPLLAGVIGAGFVRGVQMEGVGTSVKHFVANEQELERQRSSSDIDERTLREIYLRPFEIIVREARPWTVMVSYNRVNGTYMSENGPLIRGTLDREWGFDGLVVSDWGAVHSTAPAALAGLDLEMPGPPRYFGRLLEDAVRNWQVDEATIDEAVRRVLRTLARTGALEGRRSAPGELLSERHRQIALRAAGEAITLLRNSHGLLPLDAPELHSIAVIGPNADVPLYGGGGSSRVNPSRIDTPLASLRRRLGDRVQVRYARGADNDSVPPPIDARWLSATEARSAPGLAFHYYDNAHFAGEPVRSGVAMDFDTLFLSARYPQMSARWEGLLWPPQDGQYELSLASGGRASVYLDGERVLGDALGAGVPAQFDFGTPLRVTRLALKGGKAYRVRIEYVSGPIPFHTLHVGLRLPPPSLEEAVQAARDSQVAVVFVGSSRSSETEGRDRTDMQLEGRQNELVRAVLAANPHTVVVLNSGAALELPWADSVPAIVQGWLDGEGGPEAIARTLLGELNPAGKLPFSMPRRLEDTPAYLYYGPGRNAFYGEGVFVGYRYYDKRKIEPLFAFGHGLSYTTFQYSGLQLPQTVRGNASFTVSLEVANTGRRAGAEVVQLYVADEATSAVVRPVKELKGFRRVQLAPGEHRRVEFPVSSADLAYFDVQRHAWNASSGNYRILIGSSSRDIRLEGALHFDAQAAVAPAAPGP